MTVGARKQINIVVPYRMYEKLLRIASKRDVPVAVVVRDAIGDVIEEEEKRK